MFAKSLSAALLATVLAQAAMPAIAQPNAEKESKIAYVFLSGEGGSEGLTRGELEQRFLLGIPADVQRMLRENKLVAVAIHAGLSTESRVHCTTQVFLTVMPPPGAMPRLLRLMDVSSVVTLKNSPSLRSCLLKGLHEAGSELPRPETRLAHWIRQDAAHHKP